MLTIPPTFIKYAFFGVIALTAALVSCKKDAAQPDGDGLMGTWQLASRQCYCPPGPTPNETVKFTNTDFYFHKDGQLSSSGIYVTATVSPFCGGSPAAGLRLTAASGTREPVMKLSGNTLVLDYGGPCDAPVDTYQRVQ